MYRLAIFDFDGTLADTFPWFLRVMSSVADRYRFKRIEAHEIEALRHKSAREIIEHLAVPRWRLPFIARHMRALAAQDADAARLFEGVVQALEALSGAGVAVAVVSSNAEANVRRALGPRTAALVSHYRCGASMFGKATQIGKVLKASRVPPHHAIYVGDEVRDYDAAKAAGIAFGAATWGYTLPEALHSLNPQVTFDSVREIPLKLTSVASV